MRNIIARARSNLDQAQAEKGQLKDLWAEYEHGKDDYVETVDIIQKRLDEYESDLGDVKERVHNRDELIKAYRR